MNYMLCHSDLNFSMYFPNEIWLPSHGSKGSSYKDQRSSREQGKSYLGHFLPPRTWRSFTSSKLTVLDSKASILPGMICVSSSTMPLRDAAPGGGGKGGQDTTQFCADTFLICWVCWFFFKIYLLFLAALGLCCCMGCLWLRCSGFSCCGA